MVGCMCHRCEATAVEDLRCEYLSCITCTAAYLSPSFSHGVNNYKCGVPSNSDPRHTSVTALVVAEHAPNRIKNGARMRTMVSASHPFRLHLERTPTSIPLEAHAPPQHLILRALPYLRFRVGGRVLTADSVHAHSRRVTAPEPGVTLCGRLTDRHL